MDGDKVGFKVVEIDRSLITIEIKPV